MQKIECLSPVKVPNIVEKIGRCGRCKPCRTMRRIEWTNRMTLENFGLNYAPLFVTCTYAPEVLPDNKAECLKVVQKWLKRLRKKYSVRYFMVTERGDKNGRLHQHLIMWIPELAHLSPLDRWSILHKSWGLGRLEADEVRTTGAFFYTSKYILKNLVNYEMDQSRWNRREGSFEMPGRLYSWSNKPCLGKAGIERWQELVRIMCQDKLVIPPNWFNMFVLGKLKKVYIPRPSYVRFVQGEIGIDLSPQMSLEFKGKAADIDVEKVDNIVNQYQAEQLWLEEANAVDAVKWI
jgi:hypothetical protein